MTHASTLAGFLTTAEAASRLGVSPATMKRWAQSGLIPSERTEGGHRRFRLEDVQALATPADALSDPARRGADLVAGARDPHTLIAWLLQARREFGGWWAVASPLRAVLTELYRRHASGTLGSVELEVSLDRLRDAMVRLGDGASAPPGAPRLLVCAVPGDPFLTAPALVVLAAPEAGWHADWAGHPSALALEEALRRRPAQAVVVCGSAGADHAALQGHAGELGALAGRTGTPFACVGVGEWPEVRAPLARVGTVGDLHGWLTGLRAAPQPSAPPPSARALRWTPELAIGHPVVDAQHQTLFREVGGFLAALEAGEDPGHASVLAFIADYAQIHFRYEEGIMRASGFPGLEGHREEHERLAFRLEALAAALGPAPPAGALLELAGFLQAWLLEHVGGSDQRIGEHLRAKAPPAEGGGAP